MSYSPMNPTHSKVAFAAILFGIVMILAIVVFMASRIVPEDSKVIEQHNNRVNIDVVQDGARYEYLLKYDEDYECLRIDDRSNQSFAAITIKATRGDIFLIRGTHYLFNADSLHTDEYGTEAQTNSDHERYQQHRKLVADTLLYDFRQRHWNVLEEVFDAQGFDWHKERYVRK